MNNILLRVLEFKIKTANSSFCDGHPEAKCQIIIRVSAMRYEHTLMILASHVSINPCRILLSLLYKLYNLHSRGHSISHL